MTRRVYEVAHVMGLKGRELASKINSLGLGFTVNNHMSTLSEEQEEALQRAIDREARENMVEERIRATVIRRKPKRRKVVAATVTADIEPVKPAPVLAIPPEETVEVAPEPVEIDAPTPEPITEPEETVEPVVEPPEVPVEVEPVAPVDVEEPEETVAVEDPEPVVQEPELVLVADEVPEPENGEPIEALLKPIEGEDLPASDEVLDVLGGEDAPQRPGAKAILAALAKQGVVSKKGDRSAQVVGSLSPELLQQRLAVDNKTFGPPPKAADANLPTGTRETFEADQAGRRKRKHGKKVYGASELYDRRSGRRRGAKKPAGGKSTQITVAAERKRIIRMEEAILVSDLAHQMGVKAGEIALKLMFDLGFKNANINTALDYDAAALLAEQYGYSVEHVGFDLNQYLPVFEDKPDEMRRRPPVVTVMGHVDHGKTSLLDAIRTTDVAGGESGGITQHIGAYSVELPGGTVVFLDTPGHEAFTALRARGAQSTDIVVLVVAADDGVMPQTVEAINHSKDAGVPIIVAINKIDKAGANPDRVMQALAEYDLVPEAWGGETLYVNVSAKEGTGVSDVLETILLQAELLELNANPERPVRGSVIESRLDIGRGPIATVLVKEGVLRCGDLVVVGANWGRVRALTDDKGRRVEECGPAMPAEVAGLDGVPEAGEKMYGVADERAARTIASHITSRKRQADMAKAIGVPTDLEGLEAALTAAELKEVKLIVKADVQGSQEALEQALTKLSTEKIQVKIVHSAVGGITESDIHLSASSIGGTTIIGFNVRPETRAMALAEQLKVRILTFAVIYEAVDVVRQLMTGLLEPVFEEVYLGRAEVRDVFGIPKVGTIAGCYVIDGRIQRNSKARVLRDSKVVYESSISSLRRFKDDVKEVKGGFECGIGIENFNDIKLGDVIEIFEFKEIEATLT